MDHQGGPHLVFFKIISLIYFWLCWVFVGAHGLSLVMSRGEGLFSSVAFGLLIAVASLVVEQEL